MMGTAMQRIMTTRMSARLFMRPYTWTPKALVPWSSGISGKSWAMAAIGGAVGLSLLSPMKEAHSQAASEDKQKPPLHEAEHNKEKLLLDVEDGSDQDPSRYGAYAFLITRIGKSARYLAYSSDVGEAFRPVYVGYKESKKGGDVTRAVVKQSLFQGLASVLLPFLIIHTQVHACQKFFKSYAPRFLKWGPTLAGLVLIPFLPVVCDEPVEHVIEAGFDKYWPQKGEAAAEKKHH